MENNAVISFLKIAKTDLRSSKILYENKLYLQSVFLLQQTIEKCNKALAIQGEFFGLEEIKSFGHNAGSLFKGMIAQHLDEIKQVNSAKDKAPTFFQLLKDCNIDFSNYENKLIEFPIHVDELRSQIDPLKIKSEQLNDILNSIAQNYSDYQMILSKPSFRIHLRKLCLEIFEKLKTTDLFKYNVEEVDQFNNEDLTELINIMEVILIRTLAICINSYSLHIESFIFDRLVSLVRYPNINNGKFFDPTLVFTSRHPLIKSIPQFHKLLNTALTDLRKILIHSVK